MKKVYLFIFGIIILAGVFIFLTPSKKESKILFVGDLFFDRTIRKLMYEKGSDHVFSCISDFLKTADFVVGNLEGPITENASVSIVSKPGDSNNFTFTFPTITAKLLAKNNIKIVNLGNNHIGNFGKSGITSTKKYLSEVGVNYFGGLNGDEPIYRAEINGNKISFISFNEFGGDSVSKVAEKIKNEKENGQLVFVYTHWGDEYLPANAEQKRIARLFAENGATAVIGSHPHVIQESEILINSGQEKSQTIVYYSLGNFIFDQYWNKEVSTGLVLELRIKDGKVSATEHKVSLNRDGRTCLEN